MMQILWGVWLRTYKFIWNSTPRVLSEVTSSEQSDMWMGQTVHSLVGTAPALGHLIDCLHNVLFLETDLTDLILCLSNTRNMMGPSELDLSETSVSVLKMYTAWLSPKKAGSCSSVTDVCPLLEDSPSMMWGLGLSQKHPATLIKPPLTPFLFSVQKVIGFFGHLAYHFCYGT